jgi:hypothetical protein
MEHEPHGRHQTNKATAVAGSPRRWSITIFIYATAASLIFPQLFAPEGDPTVAIVASWRPGVGYAAPIGAFFRPLSTRTAASGAGSVYFHGHLDVWLIADLCEVGWWRRSCLSSSLIQGFAVAGTAQAR